MAMHSIKRLMELINPLSLYTELKMRVLFLELIQVDRGAHVEALAKDQPSEKDFIRKMTYSVGMKDYALAKVQ